MSTSTSADERESTEEVALREVREADKDEDETVDNDYEGDDDKASQKSVKTANSQSKEGDEEVENQEEGAKQEDNHEEGSKVAKPKGETGKSKVEPEDATAAVDDGPRFEENDESTAHDSDADSEDTEGPEEGFDEDPANSKVNPGIFTSYCNDNRILYHYKSQKQMCHNFPLILYFLLT